MSRESDHLIHYTGPNPFHEAQARTTSKDKIVGEFFPTSAFWSLFNDQHEILLGTRGSGKTYLLKMMSYSLLRRFSHDNAKKLVAEKSYIAFYIPLHLEFLASLPRRNCPDERKLEYFQFSFNCAAAKALLTEVSSIIGDSVEDPKQRLMREFQVVQHCCSIWFRDVPTQPASIVDLQWFLEQHYAGTAFWEDGALDPLPPLARPILTPIVSLLPRLATDLALDTDNTQWIACIDEAEFLSEPFLRCINTSLRSDKRPLVIKIATLPFKHSTRDTLTKGVCIEPNGNDFNYRIVDLPWDSDDFLALTNYICRKRLQVCGCSADVSLESFLGVVGRDDDLIDYYRLEMGEDAVTSERLLQDIVASLSPRRRANYEKVKDVPEKVTRPYLHRFGPVFFTRKMRELNRQGARIAAWFAGAKTIRRVSDGNPRRFIQVMNHLVNVARSEELTPKSQHRAMVAFCQRYFEDIEGYPDFGYLLKGIIQNVGALLTARVHGPHMIDCGSNFRVAARLIDQTLFKAALEFAIGYSLVMSDATTFLGRLNEASDLRLSYVLAVYFWLPMRTGHPVTLDAEGRGIFAVRDQAERASRRESQAIVEEYQFTLFDTNEEDTATE